jgi:hypothetical protein
MEGKSMDATYRPTPATLTADHGAGVETPDEATHRTVSSADEKDARGQGSISRLRMVSREEQTVVLNRLGQMALGRADPNCNYSREDIYGDER